MLDCNEVGGSTALVLCDCADVEDAKSRAAVPLFTACVLELSWRPGEDGVSRWAACAGAGRPCFDLNAERSLSMVAAA